MVTIQENEKTVFILPRELSWEESKRLFSAYRNFTEQGNLQFVIDASKLQIIDSFGLGTLVRLLEDVKRLGGGLTIRNLGGDSLDFFLNTGLNAMFTLENTGAPQSESDALFCYASADKLEMKYQTAGDVGIFCLYGIINNKEAARKFKEQCLLALSDKKKILLDLENLAYFDTQSIPVLVNFYRILKTSEGGIRLCNANKLILNVLSLLEIDKLIPNFESRKEALENW